MEETNKVSPERSSTPEQSGANRNAVCELSRSRSGSFRRLGDSPNRSQHCSEKGSTRGVDQVAKEKVRYSKRRRQSGSNLEVKNEPLLQVTNGKSTPRRRSTSGLMDGGRRLLQISRSGLGEEAGSARTGRRSSFQSLVDLLPKPSKLHGRRESRSEAGIRREPMRLKPQRPKSVQTGRRRSFGTLSDTDRTRAMLSGGSSRRATSSDKGASHFRRRSSRRPWSSESRNYCSESSVQKSDTANSNPRGSSGAVGGHLQRPRSSFRDLLGVLSSDIGSATESSFATECRANHSKKQSRRRSSRNLVGAVLGFGGREAPSELSSFDGDERSESSHFCSLSGRRDDRSMERPDYVNESSSEATSQRSPRSRRSGARPCHELVNLKGRRGRQSFSSKGDAVRPKSTASDHSIEPESKRSSNQLRHYDERDSGVAEVIGAGLRNMRASFRLAVTEQSLGANHPEQGHEDEWQIDPNLTIVSPTCTALMKKQESLRSLRSSIVEGSGLSPSREGHVPQFELDMGFEIDHGGTTRRSSKQFVLSPMIHNLVQQAQAYDALGSRSPVDRNKRASSARNGSARDLFAGDEVGCDSFGALLRNRRLRGRGGSAVAKTPDSQQNK